MDTNGTEQKSKSVVDGIINNVKMVITNPVEFYRTMPKTGGLGDPLVFAVVIGVVVGVLQAIIGLVTLPGSLRWASLAAVIWGPVGALIGSFIGATIGDMSTGDGSTVNNQVYIKGGDIYIDVASISSFDRIVLGRSNGTIIEGGSLHLNFLGGYTPTNGTTWDIMTRLNTGGITDPNGGNLFDRIDSNLSGFGFTAEITATPTVRITARRQGTLILLR